MGPLSKRHPVRVSKMLMRRPALQTLVLTMCACAAHRVDPPPTLPASIEVAPARMPTMAWTDALDHTEDPPCACSTGRCVEWGCFVTLAETPDNGALAIVGDTIYWRSGSSILRRPLEGDVAPTTVARSTIGTPDAFVVDATNVYWTNPGLEAVMKTPLAGGAEARLVPRYGVPTSIAVDSRTVYFATTSADGHGTIYAVPIAGGSPTAIFNAPSPITELQYDATSLYFAQRSSIERISL
ncbi:MAG TPA: hypothetical protein VF316_23425, partial [Polyangiaceae bacterium]